MPLTDAMLEYVRVREARVHLEMARNELTAARNLVAVTAGSEDAADRLGEVIAVAQRANFELERLLSRLSTKL